MSIHFNTPHFGREFENSYAIYAARTVLGYNLNVNNRKLNNRKYINNREIDNRKYINNKEIDNRKYINNR